MRFRSLGWMMVSACIFGSPIAAYADYLSSAKASLQRGDLRSAQLDLRNAVREDPQNAEAHFWLGRINLELGDPVAAEREATAARERGFDPHQAVALLAQTMLAQNQFADLLEKLTPEGKDPQLDAAILVARGYAEIGLKHQDEAQKSFLEAERLAPTAVGPLLADARLAASRSDLAGAEAKIDAALAAQPKSADALLAKAQLLRMKNDIPAAIAELDGLISEQPSVVQAHLDRATLQLMAGRSDAAKADIDMVLKGSPGNVQAIYLQAVMQAQSRDYQAADTNLARISAYVSRIQRAYYLLAVVKEQLGQFEQAEDAVRKYLEQEPNDLGGNKVLARIEFAKRRPDQVIETLAKLVESGKDDAEAYDLLGRAYATTGQSAAAIEAFQKAETLAPNNVGVQTRLASVRMGMGEADIAMGDLEHTLELAPKHPAVGEALFFAALATGDAAKAEDALARIRAAQGENEIVGNLEGLFKLAQIDVAGAKATFTDVVQKYPDFTPAKINLSRVQVMMGDGAAAEQTLADILAKQPTIEPALSMLAANYVQSNRVQDAIGLLERAHLADPTLTRVTVELGDLYIRAGTPQKALDLVMEEKGTTAGSTAILGLKAASYLALKQRKEARDAFAEIVKDDPTALGARRQLVGLLMEAGDYESARKAVSAGIALTPRNYQLYQDYVMIDLQSTGIEAALATADRLQSQDLDFAAMAALKGDIYLSVGHYADAATAYADANNAAPSTFLTTRLSKALLRAGKADEASKVLADWLGKHPDDLVAIEQASEIDIAASRFSDAARLLQQVLKLRPHHPVALNNLAWVCQQQGDDAKAQTLARQAYMLSPNSQTADTLGWILTTSGDPQTGVALLRQASSEGRSDPRILYHYGVALKDIGSKDEAKKQLEIVVANKSAFKEKTEAQKLLDDMAKGG